MAKRKRGLGHPLAAWADLALRTGEMLAASGQVIAHRTGRMARAGPNPGPRDRREFTRMGMEKVDAVRASAQAIAAHMLTAGLRPPPRSLLTWWTGANAAGAAALAGKVLHPFHSRAVANSKRLRKR